MAQKPNSKSINLFATENDWRGLLARIEGLVELYYVRGGLQTDQPCQISSCQEIEQLGFANLGDTIHQPIYLCFRKTANITIRSVNQRNGDQRNFVDQLENPDTVTVVIGGQFKENILIAGQVGTVSNSEWSLHTFSIFRDEVRRKFTKVKSYYVGLEAYDLLLKGWRLTRSARAPQEYDLNLE